MFGTPFATEIRQSEGIDLARMGADDGRVAAQ
jgi:hypothetical protein